MALLAIDNLCAGYRGRPVLHGIDLAVDRRQSWAVIGRNGTGKSTLIRTIAGLLVPSGGTVTIHDRPVHRCRARDRARWLAYVPQKPEAEIPFTVDDFVMLGRYARMGLLGGAAEADRHAVSEALAFCDASTLRHRMMTTLSGGELQRVLLAGALAQEAPLLLLDEPTTFLDPAHQRQFFQALHSARQHKALTTIMVTHDINTALCTCSHILALREGSVDFAGSTDEFTQSCPGRLEHIFEVTFNRYTASGNGPEVFGTWEPSP
jgi:iron complex transport system ATP-binding protein